MREEPLLRGKKREVVTWHVQVDPELARSVRVRLAERGERLAPMVRELLETWLKKTWAPRRSTDAPGVGPH